MPGSSDESTNDRVDEVTLDPEVTSAADGRWIAELRERARASNRSIADLLDESPRSDVPDTHDGDLADVTPVREPRPAPPSTPLTTAPPSSPPVASDDELTIDHQQLVESRRPEPKPAPTFPGDDPAPGTDLSLHPPGPTTQRWEPPPRLTVGVVAAAPPPLIPTNPSSRPTWQRIAAAVAVVLGLILAIWFLTGGNDDPVVPSDTVIPSDTVNPDDPGAAPDPGRDET